MHIEIKISWKNGGPGLLTAKEVSCRVGKHTRHVHCLIQSSKDEEIQFLSASSDGLTDILSGTPGEIVHIGKLFLAVQEYLSKLGVVSDVTVDGKQLLFYAMEKEYECIEKENSEKLSDY